MKLENLTKDVDKCISSRAHYAALSLILTFPDICSGLEMPNQRGKKRYIKWCDKYFVPTNNYQGILEGNDIYALRCAYLHAGTDDITEQAVHKTISRFRFVYSVHGNFFHRNSISYEGSDTHVLQLDLPEFCEEMIKAVQFFIVNNTGNKEIENEVAKLSTIENDEDGFRI